MGINGIGAAGYPVTEYTTKRMQQNATGKSFAEQVNNVVSAKPHTSVVYMKTDDMLYSGGNGTGLSFYIKYAEDSTEDDPTVIAKGVDENGGLTSLPPGTGMMGLHDRTNFMDMFQKQISDMKLLSQKNAEEHGTAGGYLYTQQQ